MSGAGVAGAVDGEIRSGDAGSFRQVPKLGGDEIAGWMGVDDFAAGLAVEVNVLVEVRTIAGLSALKLNLLNQSVGGEVLETIVNGG